MRPCTHSNKKQHFSMPSWTRHAWSIMAAIICMAMLAASCTDDEASSTYSKREYVFCSFNVTQYAELFNVMGNNGQFASIRKRVINGVTKIEMTNQSGANAYTVDRLSENFGFGLGGLIAGTNNYGEPMCFDLACPVCDRAERRLTLFSEGAGFAKCGKCGVVFDLNNYGVIYSTPENANITKPRGLYRYRVRFDGQTINAYN